MLAEIKKAEYEVYMYPKLLELEKAKYEHLPKAEEESKIKRIDENKSEDTSEDKG